MTPVTHSIEYARRMHRVLEYIDRHLSDPVGLAELAKIAHFSPFHFHRVFASWLGETFGEYLSRRRLEVAATCLVAQPELPVLSVALSVGFGSTEAFSRAFKLRFGSTPTAWRRREAALRLGRRTLDQAKRKLDQSERKLDQARGASLFQSGAQTVPPETLMKVTVIDRKPTPVAYLRHVGPYGESVSRFWQAVVYPWIASNGLLDRPRYGVSHDDPSITAPDKCRYDAAVEFSGSLAVPGRSMTTTLPGGSYGIARFAGSATQIADVWNRLIRDWLPSSGLQLEARPFIECYTRESTFDPKSGNFTCDLAIPVGKL